jgi:hypothetical protein
MRQYELSASWQRNPVKFSQISMPGGNMRYKCGMMPQYAIGL